MLQKEGLQQLWIGSQHPDEDSKERQLELTHQVSLDGHEEHSIPARDEHSL